MTGYIHSMETMGLVDGPGIRTVIFLSGCELRCVYCHNPETFACRGEAVDTNTLMQKLKRYLPYYQKSGGGVTFSGGEPLLQPAFLLEMLKECKKAGIHTCLDTSGHGLGDYDEILQYTDLVLFDVKHYDPDMYMQITKKPIEKAEAFLEAVQAAGVPLWVRHVVMPGLTDSKEHMEQLQNYIANIANVQKVELLPYHTMGIEKYKKLNMPYLLEGVPPMSAEKTQAYQEEFFEMTRTEKRSAL